MFEAQIRLHCPRVGGRDHDFSAREPVYVISFTPLEPYFGTVLGAFWTRREMILNLLEPQVPLHGPRSRGHDLNFSARELVHVATFTPLEPCFGPDLAPFWTRLDCSSTLLEPQVRLHGPPSRGHDREFSAHELAYVATFTPF